MADQRDKLAGLGVKRNRVQCRRGLRLVVAERYALKSHLAAYLARRQRHGVGRIHDLLLQVQILKDALKQGQGARDIHLHVQEARQGEEQPGLKHRKRDNRAERKMMVAVRDH